MPQRRPFEIERFKKPAPFAFATTASADGKETLSKLNGVIGYSYIDDSGVRVGTTAAAFIAELRSKDGEDVHHIIEANSPGGIFTEAVAIAASFEKLKGKVTVHTVGMTASAASYLAVMADEHFIAEDAQFMIHEAEGGGYGRADEVASAAEAIRIVNERLAARYVEKSSATAEEVKEWMAKTTWFSALDTVALGFADGLLDKHGIVACADPEDLRAIGAPEDFVAMVEEAAANEATDEPEAEAGSDQAETEAPAEPEAAPDQEQADQEPAELDQETQAAITAACAKAGLPDRALGFISARASLDQVRAQLFDLMAAADAAVETNPLRTDATATADQTVAARLAEIRANQFARFNRRKN